MTTRDKLHELIVVNAPLWAGEAEVFRAYWDAPSRTRETDRTWLLRQTYKELGDGFLPAFNLVDEALRTADSGINGDALVAAAATMFEEATHYCAFALAYDAVRAAADPPLTLTYVRQNGNWPENDALCRLRAVHRRDYGDIGKRARLFTEGGYCTLYSAGMTQRGRGPIGDAIAAACSKVYEDEFDHMLLGIAGLRDETFSQADWDCLIDLSIQQMRGRIVMRNAQFSQPLPDERVAELCQGRAAPLPFDYARAGLTPPH